MPVKLVTQPLLGCGKLKFNSVLLYTRAQPEFHVSHLREGSYPPCYCQFGSSLSKPHRGP